MKNRILFRNSEAGAFLFKAMVILCLFLFVGKPLLNIFSDVDDLKMELSEEETEKDLEEKEEKEMEELEKFFDSFANNDLASDAGLSKNFFHHFHDYSGFEIGVQVPPPRIS
ncbi:MAG: hypothetical protein ACI857_001807 [Arenicella sp.]|jgi:hypothetical protein